MKGRGNGCPCDTLVTAETLPPETQFVILSEPDLILMVDWILLWSARVKRTACKPIRSLLAHAPVRSSSRVHTGENYQFSFYAVQEYLCKDGIIAKPHQAVETL